MHFEIKNINNVDKLNIFENRWAEIHIINVKGKIKSISNCNASSEQKKDDQIKTLVNNTKISCFLYYKYNTINIFSSNHAVSSSYETWRFQQL